MRDEGWRMKRQVPSTQYPVRGAARNEDELTTGSLVLSTRPPGNRSTLPPKWTSTVDHAGRLPPIGGWLREKGAPRPKESGHNHDHDHECVVRDVVRVPHSNFGSTFDADLPPSVLQIRHPHKSVNMSFPRSFSRMTDTDTRPMVNTILISSCGKYTKPMRTSRFSASPGNKPPIGGRSDPRKKAKRTSILDHNVVDRGGEVLQNGRWQLGTFIAPNTLTLYRRERQPVRDQERAVWPVVPARSARITCQRSEARGQMMISGSGKIGKSV